jgi:hypothetical protein
MIDAEVFDWATVFESSLPSHSRRSDPMMESTASRLLAAIPTRIKVATSLQELSGTNRLELNLASTSATPERVHTGK